MNYYWIIGGVIIIIIIYVVYYQIIYKPKIIKLNNSNVDTIISENQIDDPDSSNYTYLLWIYAKKINTDPQKNNGNTNVFYYGPYIRLDITKDSQLDFSNNRITEYFPLEQWVFVAICVNGNFYDFYLDGKLVKTLEKTILPVPDQKDIILGKDNSSSLVDIRLANFERIPKALTHYEVEVKYEKNKYIKDYYKLPKYNLEISLKNGEKDEKTYSLYTRDQTTLERQKKTSFNNIYI